LSSKATLNLYTAILKIDEQLMNNNFFSENKNTKSVVNFSRNIYQRNAYNYCFLIKLYFLIIFKSEEGMTIWITDDKNKLPVYIETQTIIGEERIKLVKYNGLRNKIDCLVQN
jgi:hypothetical protein